MKMSFASILLIVIVAVLGCLGYLLHRAGVREWDLLNLVPTSSVADSKRLGVFLEDLKGSPSLVELGGSSYRITDLWAERQVDAQRITPFFVRARDLGEITVCVQIELVGKSPPTATLGLRISSATQSRIYGPPFRSNMCIDVGAKIPKDIVLSSGNDTAKIVLHEEH